MTGLFIYFFASNGGCNNAILSHFSVSAEQLLVMRGDVILMEYHPTNAFFIACAFSDQGCLETDGEIRSIVYIFYLHSLISIIQIAPFM